MSEQSTNRDIVSRAYEALARGDVKSFLSALDSEIVVREPSALPFGGDYHGVGELMKMFGKAGPILDASGTAVKSLTAEDDRVVAVLTMPLRGGEDEALITEHWRLRDGKAVELLVFWFDTDIIPAPELRM